MDSASPAMNVLYRIALAPFERIILQTVADNYQLEENRFGEESGDSELLEKLFNQWQWCHDVRTFIREGLEGVHDENTTLKSYDGILHMLGKVTGAYSRNEFRIAYLRRDNPNFVYELCTRHAPKIKFTPHEHDQFYWKVIGAMYRKYPEEMEFWTDPGTKRPLYGQGHSFWTTWACQYEIWKITRMFHLRERKPDNAEKVSYCWKESARLRATLCDNAAVLNVWLGGVNPLTGEVRGISEQEYDDLDQHDNGHISQEV
jgi:hypothetical protein